MFGRKAKSAPEPAREARRSRVTTGAPGPAFSYYSSRMPESTARRLEERQNAPSSEQGGKPRRRLSALIPFWLLSLLALVCLVKLLALGTDPKVVVLGKTTVSSAYLQPASTYEAAAQHLLRSSITNRTKITADLNGTAAALKQQFPELQAASVTLPLIGNRPIVYVQVAQPSVILQSTHGNYALNKSGLVLARAVTMPAGIPVVVDQSGATPTPGRQYLPGSTIGFVQSLAYQLSAAHLPVSAYVLPAGSPYELDVRLEGKPYVVRCNLAGEAMVQSGAAIATIAKLGATMPGSYLDVRVPGRVYYK